MRLIKINNDLLNEDQFIGLFWEANSKAVAKYQVNGTIVEVVVAKGKDWREVMKEAANSMLFDLEQG